MSAPPPRLNFGVLDTVPIVIVFIGFTAIALFNCLEILLCTFMTFKRRKGIYFYSLVATSLGIITYQTSTSLLFMSDVSPFISLAFSDLGWIFMVSGQSIILWSRLHLILQSRRQLKLILAMIIFDAVVGHGSGVIMSFIAVVNGGIGVWQPFNTQEKVVMVVFCLQEGIISSVYLNRMRKLLRPDQVVWGQRTRRVVVHLILVNIFIITLDVALFFIELFGLPGVWCAFKGMSYSIKLKAEFHILNQLKDLTQPTQSVAPGMELGDTQNRLHMASEGEKTKDIGHLSVVSARRGISTDTKTVNNDSILMTTEVIVQGDRGVSKSTDAETNAGMFAKPAAAPSARQYGYSTSPASSEVEFAGHGA